MLNKDTVFDYSINNEALSVEQLHEFYDTLEPVSREFMLGQWRGRCFNTGHSGEGKLGAIGWAGKDFKSVQDVFPIMSENEDGSLSPNPVMGTASLKMVEFRGVVTATMCYDSHPIFDHFKKVTDEAVLGVMDAKGDAFPLYFMLVKKQG